MSNKVCCEDVCIFGSPEVQYKEIDKGLLYEYTRVLTGSAASLSSAYLGSGSLFTSITVLNVYRYAIEIFLKWTPKEAAERFNDETATKMHLDIMTPFIALPPEIKQEGKILDYRFIIHLIYPNEIPYDYVPLVLHTYESVLQSKRGSSVKYPTGYFHGVMGRKRAIICMQYLYEYNIKNKISCESEAYKLLISDKGIRMITKFKMKLPMVTLFNGSPVQMLNSTLPKNEKSEFYKHYYEFEFRYKMAKAALAS